MLSEVYSQLGKDKPYRLPVKTEDDIEGQRPLSPQDGNVVSTQAIDVKAESPTKPRAENESEEPPSQSQRSRKKKSDTKPPAKPWEGLFDAAVLLNCSPQVVQVSDLRPSIEGGEKTWTMPIKCLVCQTKID